MSENLRRIQRLLAEVTFNLARLERDRKWGIRWTAVSVPILCLSAALPIIHWNAARPVWVNGLSMAFGVFCGGFLAQAVVRYWLRWRALVKESRRLFDELMALQAQYDPLYHPRRTCVESE